MDRAANLFRELGRALGVTAVDSEAVVTLAPDEKHGYTAHFTSPLFNDEDNRFQLDCTAFAFEAAAQIYAGQEPDPESPGRWALFCWFMRGKVELKDIPARVERTIATATALLDRHGLPEPLSGPVRLGAFEIDHWMRYGEIANTEPPRARTKPNPLRVVH